MIGSGASLALLAAAIAFHGAVIRWFEARRHIALRKE